MNRKSWVGLAAALLTATAQAKVYYVDPVNGNDDYDGSTNVWQGGSSTVGPKGTLVGVTSVAKSTGDVIYAAEGCYTNKTVNLSKSSGMQSGYYRAELAAGVKLIASGARARTFIKGRPDPAVALAASPWGCGENACRGLYLNSKAVVKGFTLTGCHASQSWASSHYGGAVNGSGYVVDCVLTNNAAPRGAGMNGPTAVRCQFGNNRGNWTGTDMQGGHSFGCSFASCNGGSNIAGGSHHNARFTGDGTDVGSFTALYNCYLNKKVAMAACSICMTNCLTTYSSQGKMGAGSAIVSGADLALDGSAVPRRTSVAVNRGVDSYYDDAFPSADLPGEKDYDLNGNPRKVGTSIDVGPFENQNPCPGHFYVDAENGDDEKDGESLANAKQSLASVCAIDTLLSGDTIHAASGVYSNLYQTVSSAKYRCSVPAGVKLVASGSRAETVIEGAPDPSVELDASPWGCGSGAVRGVYLNAKAQVSGFTIRKCRAPAFTSSTYGAATGGSGYVINCHITNNVTGRGAALNGTTAIRCLINGNRGVTTGVDSQSGNAFNSVFGDYQGSSYNTSHGHYHNCTFYGSGTADGAGTSAGDGLFNCLVLKETTEDKMKTHSICTQNDKNLGTDSKYVAPSAVKVNGFVPYRASPAVNGGSNELYSAAFPSDDLPDEVNLDYFGNPRIVGAAIDVGAVECATSETPMSFYADASAADDSGDGLTPETAKKTLAAAVGLPDVIAGDTIHAAAGVYDDGTMTQPTLYRIVVPADVTVVADKGRDKTWIVGAADTTAGSEYGFGPRAIRCAYLNANSLLVGFCLTNGVSSSNDDYGNGGGAKGSGNGYLVDCEIVGCIAYRGGGIEGVRAVGCFFHDNVAGYTGGDVYATAGLYGCTFGTSYAKAAKTIATYNLYACLCDVVNCTFVGSGRFAYGTAAKRTRFYNCLFTKDGGGFGCGITNSVGTSSWSTGDFVSSDSFVTTVAALNLGADGRPQSGSVAIDRGKNQYLGRVPEKVRDYFLKLDDPASQRVYNGTVDLGAYEYDWRGDFAKCLSRRAVVTRATTNVVQIAQGLSVADGQSLEGSLAAEAGCTYALAPTVVGDGTLTVLADGEPLEAEDGVYRFVAGPSARAIAWSIRFDGGGQAILPRLTGNAGFMVILR